MAGSGLASEMTSVQENDTESSLVPNLHVKQTEDSEPTQEDSRPETEVQEKLIKLPLTRIRGIMKTDPDVKIASHDAVVILAKAAELFIQNLSKEAAERTLRDKKKTVARKHLDDVLETRDRYAFLEGVIESFED